MSRDTKTANFFLPDVVLEYLDGGVDVRLPIEDGKELFDFLGEQYGYFPKSEWSVEKVPGRDGQEEWTFVCENCHSRYKYLPKYCFECGAKGRMDRRLHMTSPYRD